ncbi:hypothetical protein KO489_05855 [Reinekea forsetii]|nr:hypothetical protein [Reinekea forsetii]
MPVIIPILLVLGLVMLAVIKFTSQNSKPMTDEDAATYAKWFRILFPILLIGAAIKFFMG